MNTEFTQTYIHKETSKRILVKRLDCHQIVILDPETNERRRATRTELSEYKYSRKDSNPSRWKNMLFGCAPRN